jgi:hypothetical protein
MNNQLPEYCMSDRIQRKSAGVSGPESKVGKLGSNKIVMKSMISGTKRLILGTERGHLVTEASGSCYYQLTTHSS